MASTTGVVAAAKVAGDEEDEDARAAGDEAEAEGVAEAPPEDTVDAEALEPDVADVAEAESVEVGSSPWPSRWTEEFAAAGEEADAEAGG